MEQYTKLIYSLNWKELNQQCTMINGMESFGLKLFHTCKVDSKQAEDFAIANETLFEYKVPNFFNFVNNISLEGYEKRKRFYCGEIQKKWRIWLLDQ